jgi:NAD(P)-dependent dehydrogenase (short-subunit alcohol dehydrogenase family)
MGMDTFGEGVVDSLGNGTVLGRAAEPSEVAEVVAFLASPRANYTTGAIVDARGGVPTLG